MNGQHVGKAGLWRLLTAALGRSPLHHPESSRRSPHGPCREEEEEQAAATRRALKRQLQKERLREQREVAQRQKEEEERQRHEEAASAAADAAARARTAQRLAAQQAMAEAKSAEALAAAATTHERPRRQQPQRQRSQRDQDSARASQPAPVPAAPVPAQAALATSPGSPTAAEIDAYLQLLLQPCQQEATGPDGHADLTTPLPPLLPVQPAAVATAAGGGAPPLTPEEECVMCLSDHRTVVLIPCGHRAVCEDCAATLLAPLKTGRGVLCPLCRTTVEFSMPSVLGLVLKS